MILPDDIQLYQFLDYFDKSELVRYGRCSKHMLVLINQYAYLKIKRHILRIQKVENEDWIEEMMAALDISSHLRLLIVYWDLPFPLINDYRCMPTGNNYPQGGLLTIRKRYSLIGRFISDMSKDVIGFTFYYDHQNQHLMASHMDVSEQRFDYSVSLTNESLLLIPLQNPKDFLEFRTLIPSLNIRELKFPTLDLNLLSGFFIGTYGGHGHEILYVTIHEKNQCKLQLQGLKITGDKNVPAGEISFIVDLEPSPHHLNNQDTRPVIVSDTMGMFFANMEQRMSDALMICKGRGCINRFPGIWNPEYVPLVFIVYRQESQCVFSLVFEDINQNYRHGIDFSKFVPL